MEAHLSDEHRESAEARPAYQTQESKQTLAEGLAEYHHVNMGTVFPAESLQPESAVFFRSHDLCHVLFGLGTSASDEAVVDTRIMVGSTVSSRAYVGSYKSIPELKQIFEKNGFWTLAAGSLRAVPRMLRALLEARRMPEKWPWVPPESYLTRTLEDLRREYKIRII
jgi:hypothetical protein